MPLVFASNEETESGLSYDDRAGVSYEFPRMYRRLVVPGTRFLYYRGRRKVGGGRQPQVYFGSGLVGAIHCGGWIMACAPSSVTELDYELR